MSTDNLDDLIHAGEVAEILGLAHRNSVSTYRSRYADFPAGRPSPGGGRTRLWTRGEILAWHQHFQARKSTLDDQPHARLEDLVAATTRLLLGSPGREISIRQIAAEAGVPHSDLYRYTASKEQLLDLAVARIEQSMQTGIPTDYQVFYDNLPRLLDMTHEAAGAMRVLTDRALQGKSGPTGARLPLNAIADVIANHRVDSGVPSSVDPRVVAVCITAMRWGLNVMEARWLEAVDLEEIPNDQVATVVRAMLAAGE
jgi:glutathione-regulated potassium-efflux system ancillary protein KefG